MIGVERTESKSRANAANSIIASGVAGRNMVTGDHAAEAWSRKGCRERSASVLETRPAKKKRPIALVLKAVLSSYKRCCTMRMAWGIGEWRG